MIASWSFAHPWGLALLGLALPVILVHVLRPRREGVTVSSTFLWRALERPVSAATPWQRLRWSALLAAQLLAVLGLALAVARPEHLRPTPLADHTIFVIDASASMGATDGHPDRLADAIARAESMREDLPAGGRASVVVASDRPRVAVTETTDGDSFSAGMRTIDLAPGSADFSGAMAIAQSLDTGRGSVGFVVLTDGGLTTEQQRTLPAGTIIETVGHEPTNRAIERLDVETRGSGLHARLTIRNYGDTTISQAVRVDVDGTTAAERQITIGARQTTTVEVDLPAGERIAAHLDGNDLLAGDDSAVAVAAPRPARKVLIVGDQSFWSQLLTSMPDVTVDVAAAPTGTVPTPDGEGYDAVIYSGVAVPPEPRAPFLAVAPPGGLTSVTLKGVVETPSVTMVRSDVPLLAGIDLTAVLIASAQRLEAGPNAEVLVAGERAPLLLRGVEDGQRFVYLAFPLTDSNLAVQVAFPLLGDRILNELVGLVQSSASIAAGEELPVDTTAAASISGPGGQRYTLEPGDPAPRADQPGLWVIETAGRPRRLLAVNSVAAESSIQPAELIVPPSDAGAERAAGTSQQATDVLWFLVGALLVILAAEALLARRRRGVSRRQWRAALALRAVVAAALVAAAIAPVIRRHSDRQATVFVLDRSASLGAIGEASAQQWVRDSLAARPSESLAAVVVFGADARLDRVVQRSSSFDGAAVAVDSAATNIASALRLAAAVLPDDAKRRVVLVSDGRATTGDALSEATALGADGIPIDTVEIAPGGGNDAAVAGLEVPRLTRRGDQVEVIATVRANNDGPATVVLSRGDRQVARQEVQLKQGTNTVRFTDTATASPGEVLRYRAEVVSAGDTQPRNDTAFAAVPVEGPARILIVEGTAGNGAGLVGALRAGRLATTVITPAEIPSVEGLATYAGVALIDVPATSLSGAQIADLSTAVRDLGRGLLTVGGPNSYGVGGYRDSPLNDLLPVDSEILDPKRRRTVAEVLSIDTSGSMAACHCADGQTTMGANAESGGVNKTDISRAAALRAIQALASTDEIGVVAWNTSSRWALDLQQMPSNAVIEDAVARLTPAGNTDLNASLSAAAEQLQTSRAELKHIIVFTDGFTAAANIAQAARQARDLYEAGITVSVLGTGEGAASELATIAAAGHGRFYPGTNLADIPQIMAQESVIASRNFINEGNFLPEVTSNDPLVASLTATPRLTGFIAATPKNTAQTLLRIGAERDPLLATWQAGLGRVTSWTSDVDRAWGSSWSTWDGFVPFWNRVVTSTFQAGDSRGAARATVIDGTLRVVIESATPFPDGATATARVAGPNGERTEVALVRTSPTQFEATTAATSAGTYAVGATVVANGTTTLAGSALATESYPAEYAPGAPSTTTLERLARASGGTFGIAPGDAFDGDNLPAGSLPWSLSGPLLLLAALLWPIAVIVSRLSIRGAHLADAGRAVADHAGRLRRGVGERLPRLARDPDNRPVPATPRPARLDTSAAPSASEPPRATPPRSTAAEPTAPGPQPAAAAGASTLSELVERRRRRASGDDQGSSPPS